MSERYVQAEQTPTYGMLGSDFTVAVLEEGDPPPLNIDAKTWESIERSERGLGRPAAPGPAAEVRAHIEATRDALLRCSKASVIEIVARWGPDGRVRFSPPAGDDACGRVFGDLRVNDSGLEGEARAVVIR